MDEPFHGRKSGSDQRPGKEPMYNKKHVILWQRWKTNELIQSHTDMAEKTKEEFEADIKQWADDNKKGVVLNATYVAPAAVESKKSADQEKADIEKWAQGKAPIKR